MSLATQFASAIELAQFTDLGLLSRQVWAAWSAGHLTDEQAQGFAEQIEAKRPKRPAGDVTSFKQPAPPRQPQRSPDRQASIERRRRLARQSPVPPELVHEFTTSQHASMAVIVGEIQKHGVCSLCMDALAALAGTCRTVVRNTMNKARDLGLLYRKERRRRGQRSLTNLVRILRPAWQHWLKWIGRRKTGTTKDKDSSSRNSGAANKSGDSFNGTFRRPFGTS